MTLTKILFTLGSALALNAAAHGQSSMTEAKAKELIQAHTLIQACGSGTYNFTSVQLGTKLKSKYGGKDVEFFPVHARFAVTCLYGTEQMRAEVDYTTAFYRDPFGAWQASGPNFDGDQSWNNTQSDVRCRVQNLAHLTLDPSGKVLSSTPAKDQGFMGCTVMSKAAD